VGLFKVNWGLWIATAMMLIVVGLVVYLLLPQSIPACATDINDQKAKTLFVQELADRKYASADDAEGFRLDMMTRDDENNWPTYFATFKGAINGKPRVLQSIGDGCAFTDLVDLTPRTSGSHQ
jgi:hypothetical protein